MSPNRNVTTLNERSVVNLVAARLLDYFARRTDWQRRLWNPGTVTVLRELLEAVDLLERGHLRSVTVKELAGTARRRAGPDLGMGSQADRSALETTLSRLYQDPADVVAKHQLDFLLAGAETNYFERWDAADPREVAELGPESISRLLAGHLLGIGFSPDYLHRWATWLTTNKLPQDLADIFTEARAVAVRPTRSWEVLVPFMARSNGTISRCRPNGSNPRKRPLGCRGRPPKRWCGTTAAFSFRWRHATAGQLSRRLAIWLRASLLA